MLNNKWDIVLQDEYQKEYFKKLILNIKQAYQEKTIFPPKGAVFRALQLTDYDNVKVVILGQDPYHGVGEANGLSFSVNRGVKLPPSLKNIYKELASDVGIIPRESGDLTCWASEGVLLLNAILTVEKDKPASHQKFGWEQFTDAIIQKLNEKTEPVVFILWGNYARSKKKFITNPHHCIIESVHPSPFSCQNGFFGSKPFSRANQFLKNNNLKEIDWTVDTTQT